MKLMTQSAMILRFEAEIAKPVYPEDADRKFIIAYTLGDDQIAVYEMKRRNSGFMEGKFAEKSKKKDPITKKWYDRLEYSSRDEKLLRLHEKLILVRIFKMLWIFSSQRKRNSY